MLIQGNISGNKTQFLIEYFIDLINKGINPDEILVILQNSYKKADFIKRIEQIKTKNILLLRQKTNVWQPPSQTLPLEGGGQGGGDKNAHKLIAGIITFSGLCYNAFLDNWKFLSGISDIKTTPNLCGLEVSQFIFKESIKTADFSDYISKINLLHQLFRRYSLIVQNGLSNKEVLKRSQIIGESFAKEAQKAIDDYKIKTFKYNSFDYLRQIAVFPLIYNNTDYFKNIKYLIVDDADEFSYAFWQFVYKIMPNLSDYFIAYDEKGSSRCGYLCAYKSGIEEFIKDFSPKIRIIQEKSNFNKLADEFFYAVKKGEKFKISQITHFSKVKRLDMLQEACNQIKTILKNGAKEDDISIITPIEDDILFECLNSYKINFQLLSGNQKLIDDTGIKFIITTLKLINNLKISEFELKNIFVRLLKIPVIKCFEILKIYKQKNILTDFDFENEKFNYAYKKFLSVINSVQKSKNSISEQIKIIKENLFNLFNTEFSIEKYNFLIKEAISFETAFSNNIKDIEKEFIIQTENSIISENPSDITEIKGGKVIVSSPQKIIDYGYKTKYQLWLDISSSEWIKNDTGTLYNAWVLSKDFTKNNFTLEDNILLTKDKTARMIRKLMLCAEQKVIFFSSLYDNTGSENFGGICDFIEEEEKKQVEFKITPRSDQKGVLDYKSGKMGIMAVPGAGKTTILLALIIKMLKEGVKSENIFVLTYMESAAKNFKEKIKNAMPQTSSLPNISTIHGLALRIIKENGNYGKIGLDENFEICDDNSKENIIRSLFYKLKIDEALFDNYFKCISEIKLSSNNPKLHSKYKEIQDFFDFYIEYNNFLKQNNLVDYDDMLCYSVELLEQNIEIRQYYQNLCKYIIEDEAQDSTDIQQKLIGILSAKYNNLVRCGDVNQAITSTFTNSNPESFKNFINQNKKIEMVSSQRCAKPIYTLANKFLKEALKTTNAFYDIQMKETIKNPLSSKNPEYLIFEHEKDEKEFILNTVKNIRIDNPDASIAILLRLNSQVNDYNELFLSDNIKTSVRTDCPSQKSIYKIIFNMLKIIENPFNNNNIENFASICRQKKIYKIKQSDIDFIKNLKIPFVSLNPDEINTEALLQLYFDIDYHLNKPSDFSICALNTGLYYAQNTTDKSNAYMIATLIKRLETECKNEEELLTKLDYAAQKNSGSYKFFEENEIGENTVNIMTMHKSKGDEFDYVFIPQLNTYNYAIDINSAKIKSEMHFLQSVKVQSEIGVRKSNEELKQEQVNETLRLLYVGITRAKQLLYFTNAKNYLRRKNTKPLEIIQSLTFNS